MAHKRPYPGKPLPTAVAGPDRRGGRIDARQLLHHEAHKRPYLTLPLPTAVADRVPETAVI